jgi:hypothetical protein
MLQVEGGQFDGVVGHSNTGSGVIGVAVNNAVVVGDSNLVGVLGRGTGNGVVGRTDSPSAFAIVATSAGGLPTNNGLAVFGRFTATGTKNAVVPLHDGQHVLLTAEESTEVWFSDYGTAQLVRGRAVVQIDRVFMQTVNTAKDYHVFLTARGNPGGSLYIDNETPSSFEIRETTGTANITVSYRIVAKRKDFASERLKRVTSPYDYAEPLGQSATWARDGEGMKRIGVGKAQLKASDSPTAASP